MTTTTARATRVYSDHCAKPPERGDLIAAERAEREQRIRYLEAKYAREDPQIRERADQYAKNIAESKERRREIRRAEAQARAARMADAEARANAEAEQYIDKAKRFAADLVQRRRSSAPPRVPVPQRATPIPVVLAPVRAAPPGTVFPPASRVVFEMAEHLCRYMGVSMASFLGTRREKRAVLAREIVVYLSRQYPINGLWASYPEITRGMGRSNHSTTITMHRRAQRPEWAGHGLAAEFWAVYTKGQYEHSR